MGNYNCCSQKQECKKTVRLKSIRTTTSIRYDSDSFQKKNLLSQFTQNFSQPLECLRRNRGSLQICPSCFNVDLKYKIGKGAHSDVYLVETDYQTNFMEMAAKIIPKSKLTSDSMRKSIAMQNLLLLHNDCSFLMRSHMSRQDENHIYYFCPLAIGGDLSSFNQQCSGKGAQFIKAEEDNVRFILAGIILGLEYIHKIGIILNDLKLENVLICTDGYPLITDFGLVQPQGIEYFGETVGTLTYFSPDKLYGQQYTKAVDFWALGVLIYSLVYRQYPFDSEVIQSVNFLNQVRAKQKKHKKMSIKGSKQLKDLINCLLLENPTDRLGVNDIQDLKKHKFFSKIDWEQYQSKTVISPLKAIVEKYPIRRVNHSLTNSNVKVFRQCTLEDEFLYPIQSTLKLKKSLCSTADRVSRQPSSQDFIVTSPLCKTYFGSSVKRDKIRKKSVSFELRI